MYGLDNGAKEHPEKSRDEINTSRIKIKKAAGKLYLFWLSLIMAY
jgi:hypothetical protein